MAEPITKEQTESPSLEISDALKELLKSAGPGVQWAKVSPESLTDLGTIKAAKERFYQRRRAQIEAAKAAEASQHQNEMADTIAVQGGNAVTDPMKSSEAETTEAALVDAIQTAGDKIAKPVGSLIDSKGENNKTVEEAFSNLEEKVLELALTESSVVAAEVEEGKTNSKGEINIAGDEESKQDALNQKILAKTEATKESPFMEDTVCGGSCEVALL